MLLVKISHCHSFITLCYLNHLTGLILQMYCFVSLQSIASLVLSFVSDITGEESGFWLASIADNLCLSIGIVHWIVYCTVISLCNTLQHISLHRCAIFISGKRAICSTTGTVTYCMILHCSTLYQCSQHLSLLCHSLFLSHIAF